MERVVGNVVGIVVKVVRRDISWEGSRFDVTIEAGDAKGWMFSRCCGDVEDEEENNLSQHEDQASGNIKRLVYSIK